MRPIKPIYFIAIISILLASCIEWYYPREVILDSYSFVVSGQVTDVPGYQYIRVSKASPITKPKFLPVAGCNVVIIDSDNNVFASNSNGSNGEYSVWIDGEYLTPGKAFKVLVTTPSSIEIESEYDTLKPCPDINKVYFKLEENPTPDPAVFNRGIQFKVDLIAGEQYDRYFRWEIEETYEYKAFFPITLYYDGEVNEVDPPDFSLFNCWGTNPINNIYTVSTKGLVENKFVGYNLHFVNNRTQKLMYLYSIKLTQYSLSENFYNYWEQLRMNSSEQGGMFDTQPITINGNLFSPSHPEMRILGFFGASSAKTERYFFSDIENLYFELPDFCTPTPLDLGFEPFSPLDYPIYLVIVDGQMRWANKSCFDCTESGGTTEKPPFWP